MDVGEAERLQLRTAHVPRPRLGLGAGRPRPDFGGQPLDDVPGDLVLQRRVAKALGLARILGEGGEGEERQRRAEGFFMHGP